MVYRVYVEKKKGFDNEARLLGNDIKTFLMIKGLDSVRVLNRYDVENISRELFDYCRDTVFSEPQLDDVSDGFNAAGGLAFAVEYLPGQFDQRADSAAQCIQIISQGERPTVKTAKVYILNGTLSEDDVVKIKKHVINPVEAREAGFDKPDTLIPDFTVPTEVETLHGFNKKSRKELSEFISAYALAMDTDDIVFLQEYFVSEKRDPTLTEIRMVDTYWSDHCRHTTFLTTIDSADFEDAEIEKTYREYLSVREALGRKKPVNLMDIATIACRYLKKEGKLDALDESDEINACTVKINVSINGKPEKWLLLFKNETHNHPTEIEPFGGAATCIGGAIRDPLSGRAYVYAAMRVTGAGDPLKPVSETIKGKLPQRKLVTTAAAGYSSYGNQIGLATGIVDELYHDGYAAKRLEIGAVIAAAPENAVRREVPAPGDAVILLGGRTGRDGCGGATGSSKSHTLSSLETCGAEVQKGNAPEERKLQRLFRDKEASLLIKRCNDFGAGGVSVAIGELADGLEINLNAVPKKYEGLDGTELAISESQERMAVVVAPEDVGKFLELADKENLEATVVAVVSKTPRLTMKWNGKTIVDVSRKFLDSNGAEKHTRISVGAPEKFGRKLSGSFKEKYTALMSDLNVCSKRGLSERFDSTIGAGTVLMPFGGKNQLTPIQSMAHKISSENGETDDCSLMSYGYNPYISEKSPYHGAYLAVIESVSKLIASGASFEGIYLTFQEYFEKLRNEPERWGKPAAALLGAFKAQLDLSVASIGGKDSMSGSFEKLDVPPTLVSFAVTTGKCGEVRSPEFKGAAHKVIWLKPEYKDGIPEKTSLIALFEKVHEYLASGKAVSAYTPVYGGVAEAIAKMCFGNGLGFKYSDKISEDDLFGYAYGSFILELSGDGCDGICLGETTDDGVISRGNDRIDINKLLSVYENKLEPVYPCNAKENAGSPEKFVCEQRPCLSPAVRTTAPRVLIPVFPGTNCEYDSAKAVRRAGAEPEIIVINNIKKSGIAESVAYFAKRLKEAQMIFIPGGFSGGDEPDGSGKFITAFFRNASVKEAVTELLDDRYGLICGICNGFQALIKLGLVPYGKIIDTDETSPTLTFNSIGRHQPRIVYTRVASVKSPWMSGVETGDVFAVPISHGEGRFIAGDDVIKKLAENGQIATQYANPDGDPTYDISFNPNNSVQAIEGIFSPDGRVFGKMGHTERYGEGLYRNIPGNFDMKLFESAVKYFSL